MRKCGVWTLVAYHCGASGHHTATGESRTWLLLGALPADYTLTTAHKSKRLEWNAIGLYDDFSVDPLAYKIARANRNDELNLPYVPVTRAMQTWG